MTGALVAMTGSTITGALVAAGITLTKKAASSWWSSVWSLIGPPVEAPFPEDLEAPAPEAPVDEAPEGLPAEADPEEALAPPVAVSYTHLTLPTIYSV